MNNINDLIKELCPNGITYKSLDDVCDKIYAGGTPLTSHPEYYNGDIKWLRSGEIDFNELYDTEIKITELGLNNSSARMIPAKSVVIAMTGATAAKTAIVMEEMCMNQSVCAIIPNDSLNYRFLFQCLVNKYDELRNMGEGVLTSLNLNKIKKIVIPIPPLKIQEKIVDILEKFDRLISIVENQQKLSILQYEYSVNNLLFNKEYNKFKIRDICSIKKGKSPIQKTEPGDYPMVVTTEERKSSKEYQFDTRAVCVPLVSSRGHGVASLNHVYYQEGKFALGNILCAIESLDNDVLDTKYLYYYLESTKEQILVPLMKGGANVSLHMDDIYNVEIYVPDVQKQKIIISNLDKILKYQKILKDKIHLLKKQSEYYRNKLLSFEELSVNE